jgi:hypothetical protein
MPQLRQRQQWLLRATTLRSDLIVIDPNFLAAERRLFYAQDLLTWVQLEQLAPQWWPEQEVMAQDLGCDRGTLCRSLGRLQKRGLIRVFVCAKKGTWVWWVKRAEADRVDLQQAPHWLVRDVQRRVSERIVLGQERAWSTKREIPHSSVTSLLYGRIELLRGRWKLAATPWGDEDL